MDAKNTIIVNLYGAPGAGKSSGAAYIFYKLKQLGVDAELVTEYAKDKVWEGHELVFKDSCYIFGHQHYRLARVYGKVDVIVTDAPLFVSCFYATENFKKELTSIAYKTNEQWLDKSLSYFINRTKKYNPNGRHQTESESDEIAVGLKEFLKNLGINCTEVNGNEEGYDKIVEDVMSVLEGRAKTLSNIYEGIHRGSDFTLNQKFKIEFTEKQLEKLRDWSRGIIKYSLVDGFEPYGDPLCMELTPSQMTADFKVDNPYISYDGQYIVIVNGDDELDYIDFMKWLNCWK